jgi:general stress protein 26
MDNHDDNLKKLHEMIKDIKFAMLTTVDEKGSLRARPMATLEADVASRELWFFTAADSPKVEDAKRDMRVNLAYASPNDNRYVSVSGVAQLVRDREKIRQLWKPPHKVFFPEGPDDPNLALLRVTAYDAEYWTGPITWIGKIVRFAAAAISGDYSKVGENEKISL